MKPLRVLLADDHTLVRAGIRSLLEHVRGVQVVAEASNGRQALELGRTCAPDVAVVDIGMPELNGIETTLRLRQELPAIRVVILSMHDNEEYVTQAIQAGAAAYLLKKSAVAELETALRAVQQGQTYLSPSLARGVPMSDGAQAKAPESPLAKLTPRQREILQLIAESRTTKEIALMLKVSPKTVEFHRAGLMQRLNIHDVPGLVRFALRRGLTPPEA
jgi:DNA-binding NarL/FixJ family response regulator